MMKANELRLGNYVNYGVNIVPIKSIHTESVLKEEVRVYVELNEKLQNYCLDITELEPIPLTEEWLLKFGFEEDREDENDIFWSNDNVDLYVRKVGGKFAFCVDDYHDGGGHTIHFLMHTDKVHTFQNNAFALMGEDLTFGNKKSEQ